MRQFNLDEYLQMKAEGRELKIVTRSGYKARIICTDVNGVCPVIGVLENVVGSEYVYVFLSNGQRVVNNETPEDLFFADIEEKPLYKEKPYDFKPFDKVLVRNSDNEVWVASLFSHYVPTSKRPYWSGYQMYKFCIPFEGNEELVGTTNEPKTK